MSKIIIRTLFFFIVLSVPQNTHAQTHDQNHRKYWYYRFRLLNDFVKHGFAQGESMVASQHGFRSGKNFLKFGDQTVKIGFYLGVLATEYELLSSNNQSTQQTVEEIYYVLSALNRLDLNAESRYRPGSNNQTPASPLPGDLNGFFCRDDVLEDNYLTLYSNHFNNSKITRQSNALTETESDWGALEQYPCEMSKDQVIYLMVGLSLLSEFVPETVVYESNEIIQTFVDGESSLTREGGNILSRILQHVNGKGDNLISWPWIIRNWVTSQPVTRGPNAAIEAWAIARAACLAYPDKCSEFQNGWSSGPLALLFWRFAWLGSTVFQTSQVNAGMWTTLKGVSGDIYSSPLQAGAYYSITTLRNTRWTALLHQVLHGGPNLINSNYYEYLLNDAPCEGPYLFAPDIKPSFEWSASNRLIGPDKRLPDGSVVNDGVFFTGEYNGLDYMLLHNLYYLVQSQYYQSPVNFMENNISTTLPFSGLAEIGTVSFPLNVEMFDKLTASNTILPTSATGDPHDVTYRAGCSIHLTPGFNVNSASGSSFHAFIDPFECASDGSYRNAQATQDSVTLYGLQFTDYGEKDFYLHREESPTVHYHFNFDESDPEPVLPEGIATVEEMDTDEVPFIEIFPNPSSEIVTITLPQDFSVLPGTVEIYGINGQRLESWRTDAFTQKEFNCSNWSAGLYVVRFMLDDLPVDFTKKFVVQH